MSNWKKSFFKNATGLLTLFTKDNSKITGDRPYLSSRAIM